ncbi:Calcium-independent phospholipase A2-gamma [Fusarium austroafricanum]|uniref:Calcium-independent phospholipase A2-gamma n=1 Tax=Fusarium austroafricanum TaxID=2364996 RepID=A0A8H4KXF7_9HYPO|nr:Calcium-independent phospholipase A2-gamma [Fusarium austroafricanum]
MSGQNPKQLKFLSLGRIIALMLGRMRMSIDDCINEYQRLGSVVFGKPRHGEYMFDKDILVRETKAVIAKYLGEADAPLLDPLGDDACKTVVYTLPYQNAAQQTATALRTYINVDKDAKPKAWTIWEAVRATSAALTVFEPFVHGPPGKEIRYMDAGFGFNNPSDLILDEARSLWEGDDHLSLREDVGVFLSLGTGVGHIVRMENDTVLENVSAKFRAPAKAVNAMKSIVTGTNRINRTVASQFGSNSVRYYRFNVDQGVGEVKLFDHKKREEMEVDTDAYLERFDVGNQVKRCVDIMKVLPVREPGLLDNRNEEEDIYSLGDDGTPEQRRLLERLKALRIKEEYFIRHKKEWEGQINRLEATYHKRLYREVEAVGYLWDAVVQADLLDERGREILVSCTPNPDRLQLKVTDDCKDIAYYSPDAETPEKVAARIELANQDLSNAFHILRQLLGTAATYWEEQSFVYCWVAKRMGGILEIWGCRREARNLYLVARDGKVKMFGVDHWSVKRLQEKLEKLTYSLRE